MTGCNNEESELYRKACAFLRGDITADDLIKEIPLSDKMHEAAIRLKPDDLQIKPAPFRKMKPI